MIKLPQITLIAVATATPEQALKALLYSCRGIEFGDVKLVSNWRPNNYHSRAGVGFEYVDRFATIDDWNHYIFYNLWKHVDTEFCLLVHEDGFVVNPALWRDEFLHYDYIGSPWPMNVAIAIQGGREQELVRVGNSVSIRSKRLLELPSKLQIPWRRFNNDSNEDTAICAHYRKYFTSCGMTFAPVELAVHFGRELEVPEGKGIEPFLFHKYSGKNSQFKGLI